LEIKFRDKSIAEVLAMTVDEAVPYFSAQTRIHDRLRILQQVHPVDELSLAWLRITGAGPGEPDRLGRASSMPTRLFRPAGEDRCGARRGQAAALRSARLPLPARTSRPSPPPAR